MPHVIVSLHQRSNQVTCVRDQNASAVSPLGLVRQHDAAKNVFHRGLMTFSGLTSFFYGVFHLTLGLLVSLLLH